jgi:hypothetical protein
MNFSFKSFLPKIMRETRWGELIEVWQSVYSDIRADKVNPIFTQYDLDNISESDIKDLAVMLGYTLKSYSGYTSEYNYLIKELRIIVSKIKNKNTPTSYILMGIPFNLISNAYSMFATPITENTGTATSGTVTTLVDSAKLWGVNDWVGYKVKIVDGTGTGSALIPILSNDATSITVSSWPVSTPDATSEYEIVQKFGVNESSRSLVYYGTTHLDRGDLDSQIGKSYILTDTTLDSFEFESLDRAEVLFNLTRNICFSYIHKYTENTLEFMGLNTVKALLNDVNQNKRLTDRIYFEPTLTIEFNGDRTVYDKQWTDFQGTNTFLQKNLLVRNNFSSWSTIRFGNGSYVEQTTSDYTLANWSTLSYPLTADADDISGNSNNGTPTDILWTDSVANFNGSTSNIVLPISIDNIVNYSFSFWFKRNGLPASTETLITNYVDANNNFILELATDGKLNIYNTVSSATSDLIYADIDLCDDVLHHVVLTIRNSIQVQLIIDGVAEAISTLTVPIEDLTAPTLYIGSLASAEYFTGQMSQFILFSRIITGTEALWLFANDIEDIEYGNTFIGDNNIGNITDVNNFVFEWDYVNDTNKIIEQYDRYCFRFDITELQKLQAFTEMVVMDDIGRVVLYSTLPKVQWDIDMYSGLKLDFIIYGLGIQYLNGTRYLDGTWYLTGTT